LKHSKLAFFDCCFGLLLRAASLDELHRQEIDSSVKYQQEITELAELCTFRVDEVDRERQELMDRKKFTCLSAVSSRSGKPIQAKVRRQYIVYYGEQIGVAKVCKGKEIQRLMVYTNDLLILKLSGSVLISCNMCHMKRLGQSRFKVQGREMQ